MKLPPDSTVPPRISIILLAYRRSKFVASAIRSVAAQTIKPEQIELVVVTDLPEITTLDDLRKFGLPPAIKACLVSPGPVPLGTSVVAGVRASSGAIVTFLNDDDEWEPERLEFIASSFESDPTLGFFHNSQLLIDSNGRQSPRGFLYSLLLKHPSVLRVKSDLHLTAEAVRKRPWLPKSYEPDFNSSSIAVRGSTFIGYLDVLLGLSTLDDSYLFYASLVSKSSALLTGRRLTRYRLHDDNITFHSMKSSESILAQSANQSISYLESMRRLREFMQTAGGPDLRSTVDLDERYINLVHRIQDVGSGRRDLGAALFRALSVRGFLRTWKNLVAVMGGCIGIISPLGLRHLYARI